MSKLDENIFPAPKMNISFVYFAYLIEWRQKVDRIFYLPTNVFVESTAFAFVSYICWFDIHFALIAQIKFSNWITSYTKLMENMSMKCQTTTKLNACMETIWIRFILQTLTSTCNEDKQFTTFDLNSMQNMLSDFLVSYLSCWNIRYQIWHCMWDINHGLAQALIGYHHVIVSFWVILSSSLHINMSTCHHFTISSCQFIVSSNHHIGFAIAWGISITGEQKFWLIVIKCHHIVITQVS